VAAGRRYPVRVAEVLDHAWFCEAGEAEVAALAAVVADVPDLSAVVPTCPGWTLADLAAHAGARRVALFHHRPDRTDDALDELAHRFAAAPVPVVVAAEEQILDV